MCVNKFYLRTLQLSGLWMMQTLYLTICHWVRIHQPVGLPHCIQPTMAAFYTFWMWTNIEYFFKCTLLGLPAPKLLALGGALSSLHLAMKTASSDMLGPCDKEHKAVVSSDFLMIRHEPPLFMGDAATSVRPFFVWRRPLTDSAVQYAPRRRMAVPSSVRNISCVCWGHSASGHRCSDIWLYRLWQWILVRTLTMV